MDPSEQRNIKAGSNASDETSQAGYWLVGAVVLIAGGVVLLAQSHAGVADFGGGMLILMGLALGAAAIWVYTQQQQ
jgi:hypothetical protein